MSRHHNPTPTHPHREPIPSSHSEVTSEPNGRDPWAKTIAEVKRSLRRFAVIVLVYVALVLWLGLTYKPPPGYVCVMGPRNNAECARPLLTH